ncbi:MAG: hypothetical protein E7160_04565 [Firmicutes bacterium]|nr:hypothetical protein [Bacillota bacterium]
MKKIFKFILFLIICCVLYKFYIFIFVNSFSSNYVVNKYDVFEKFNKTGKNNVYSFTIKNKKNRYVFSYNYNFYKKRQIIKDIKYYKKNKLKCIYPIYLDNKYSDLYCLYSDSQVSVSYLKQISNKDIDSIISKLDSDGYSISYSDKSSSSVKSDFITVYKDNIVDDYIYTVWYYKGINIIDSNGVRKVKFSLHDKYENDLSMIVGDYYVTFNQRLNSNHEYSSLILYNLITNKKSLFKLKKPLSINTYINGVYNNKLYVTDNDSRKQYSIDFVSKKIKKVGDRGLGYKKLTNSKFEVIRANKDNYFDYTVNNKSITKLYGDVTLYKGSYSYYYINDSDEVYEIINNEYRHPILLFKVNGIKELKVRDGNVSFISDNIIYNYNDINGLKEIVVDNELRYNYLNVYDLMKK